MRFFKGLLLIFVIYVFCYLKMNINMLTPLNILLILVLIIGCYKYYFLKKQLIAERNYFIKTLNHDLRVASLAQIRALDLLEEQSVGGQKDFVKDINDSCKYSFDMITTLLNTYKFKNKELFLDYDRFNLGSLVRMTCEKFSKTVNQKSLDLHLVCESQVFVDADKLMLTKAISTLISVAIMNSENSEQIEITVKNYNDSVMFSISYNGRGLTEEECRRLFSEEHSYSTVGLGIKMQFCKKIIEFHRGKMMLFKNESGNNMLTFVMPSFKKQALLKKPNTIMFEKVKI